MISRRALISLPLATALAARATSESLLRAYPLGGRALSLELTATTGRKSSLASLAAGRPLVAVGTLRDCPFGVKLQPLYNALAEALAKDGIAFAGVTPDAPAVALEQVRRTRTPFPVLCDERSELLRSLHIWVSYTFALVEPSGRTVWTAPGASRATISAAVEMLDRWRAEGSGKPLARRADVQSLIARAPESALPGCVFYDGTEK